MSPGWSEWPVVGKVEEQAPQAEQVTVAFELDRLATAEK
jgi:hypothetical protein